MASRLPIDPLEHELTPGCMTVLFVQAVNDSRTLTYIVENFLNLRNTNPKTSTLVFVNIPLKQMPFVKWKVPPKRGKITSEILGHEIYSISWSPFIDKECEFITFTAGQEDKLLTNVGDTRSTVNLLCE